MPFSDSMANGTRRVDWPGMEMGWPRVARPSTAPSRVVGAIVCLSVRGWLVQAGRNARRVRVARVRMRGSVWVTGVKRLERSAVHCRESGRVGRWACHPLEAPTRSNSLWVSVTWRSELLEGCDQAVNVRLLVSRGDLDP